jgi:hypothetical protein
VDGEEELRARAVLAEMQMRISQGPYSALSVAESASAEEVRAAFLQLTKQFHPARFGRMSNDVHRLANEVFLGIKGAHDQLIKYLGSSGRIPTARHSSAVPIVNSSQGGTVRGTGLVARTQTQPQTSPIARGTDRAGTRPSAPALTPPSGLPRPSTPLTTPSSGTQRAPSPIQPTQPLPRQTPAAGIPIQRPTPPTGIPIQRPTPPTGIPIQRPSGSSLDTPERPTPASGIPAQPRPTSPLPTHQVRPGTPPNRTPAPEVINPPTIRYSGAATSQQMPRAGATDEETELRNAMNLLSSKDWSAARSAFHALAAKLPQSRRYRALLCYARGRETQATGRNDDALLEFQRALQLDPDLDLAKDAIREVQRKSRW